MTATDRGSRTFGRRVSLRTPWRHCFGGAWLRPKPRSAGRRPTQSGAFAHWSPAPSWTAWYPLARAPRLDRLLIGRSTVTRLTPASFVTLLLGPAPPALQRRLAHIIPP